MNGSQNMINDLLVGLGIPQAANNSAKGMSDGQSAGNDFAALLGMLSGIGINPSNIPTNSLLKLQASQTDASPVQAEGTGVNLFASQMVASLEGNANLLGIASSPSASTSQKDPSTKPGGSTVVTGTNSQKILQMLSSAPISGVSSDAGQIPDGKYKVISAAITDGKLDLQLVSKDDEKSEVHLTIPVELLQSSAKGEVNPLQPLMPRIAAAQPATESAKAVTSQSIADLFSQLKVSEVAISKASLPSSQAGQPMTAISFSEGLAISAPVLSTVIPTAQIKTLANVAPGTGESTETEVAEAFETTSPQDGKVTTSGVSFLQSDAPKPIGLTNSPTQIDAQPMFRTAAVRINSKVLTQDSSAIGKLLGDTDKSDAAMFKTDMSDSALRGTNLARPVVTSANKLDQPAVRITLPQNLSSLLDGHGRSINIKLEPDYLGPARLNLSMRGEALTAKLTVETQQAKAAVENSITQLTDQLAKAGIKVDFFDVSMRGGGAGQESFHRPQDWFASSRPHIRDIDDESSLDSLTLTDAPTARRDTTYLNGRGVNLYA